MTKSFHLYMQIEAEDCGPTCLKIIAKHYGKTLNIQTLPNLSETLKWEVIYNPLCGS